MFIFKKITREHIENCSHNHHFIRLKHRIRSSDWHLRICWLVLFSATTFFLRLIFFLINRKYQLYIFSFWFCEKISFCLHCTECNLKFSTKQSQYCWINFNNVLIFLRNILIFHNILHRIQMNFNKFQVLSSKMFDFFYYNSVGS